MKLGRHMKRGDTIVEVLFAMVVIGLSLAAAFGIANRGLQLSRASQERTEAQKIAESQIELIKLVLSSDSAPPGVKNPISNNSAVNFCLYKDPATGAVSKENNNQDECKIVTQLDSGVDYTVSIDTQRESSKVTQYEITVTWERIGTDSDDPGTLTLYYRPGFITGFTSPSPSPSPSPVPPPVPPPPVATCTAVPETNISDYVNSNVTINRRPGVQDIYYNRDGMYLNGGSTGVQPVKSVNNGRYFPQNPNNQLSSWSHPDIIIPAGFQLDPSCNYSVDWEVYCSRGNPIGSLPTNPCDDQQNEAAIILMYDAYVGSGDSVSCSGNLLASFRTSDVLGTPVTWNGISLVQVDLAPSEVRCVELEHVCVSAPLLCAPPTNETSSVFVNSLRWISTP